MNEASSIYCRPNGNHPIAVVVWTLEKNEANGFSIALLNQKVWGGWVFMSKTAPGYVAWFDSTYTPSEIFSHTVTQGHSGVLNPPSVEIDEVIQSVARSIATKTGLPQEVFRDRDGYLNHTEYGYRYIGTGIMCVLPEQYYRRDSEPAVPVPVSGSSRR